MNANIVTVLGRVKTAGSDIARLLPTAGGNLSTMSDATEDTRSAYARYVSRTGEYRNDILRNRGVLWQVMARDESVIRALRHLKIVADAVRVLDVGCGTGQSLSLLPRLGFEPAHLFGVDILPERIMMAQKAFPGLNFSCEDATALSFEDRSFDIVMESTMFLPTSDEIARLLAFEMSRVVKSDGHLLITDWRYGRGDWKGVGNRRLSALFPRFKRVGTFPGALIPPVGRWLSAHAPALYLPVRRLLPPLAGQRTVILEFAR